MFFGNIRIRVSSGDFDLFWIVGFRIIGVLGYGSFSIWFWILGFGFDLGKEWILGVELIKSCVLYGLDCIIVFFGL